MLWKICYLLLRILGVVFFIYKVLSMSMCCKDVMFFYIVYMKILFFGLKKFGKYDKLY